MGGYSSGRYRTRNRGTVDAALRLDIRVMRRQGFLSVGSMNSGVQRWSRVATGEETGSVSVCMDLIKLEGGQLTVDFKCNGERKTQIIQLERVPMRFGGWRFYFLCPLSGCRCEVLPFAKGIFASRRALRFAYQSQSEDRLGRLRDKARRLERQLWPKNGKGRPRGRRRRELVEAWAAADQAFDGAFARMAMSRFGMHF
jgi:hypothetical protein